MELFVASIGALLIGPLAARMLRARRGALVALDGFVLVGLLVLLGFEVLPEAFAEAGGYAAVAAAAGFVLPSLAERRLSQFKLSPMVVLALAGLAVHGMLDGAALEAADHHGHHHGHGDSEVMLAVAVVLHRLPMGLFVWWTVAPYSRKGAWLVLAIEAGATAVGFFGAESLLAALPQTGLAIFQALVAGSLVHVIVAHGPVVPTTPQERMLAGVGATIAGVILVALAASDPGMTRIDYELDAERAFLALALESAPALLIAFALAGMATAVVGPRSTRWLRRGGAGTQALKGVAFGLPLPICSCGVLPMYQSLLRAGVPTAAGMGFLIATPEIGIDAILLSVPLLGTEMAIVRVAAAAVVALAVGALVGRWLGAREPAEVPSSRQAAPLSVRVREGLRYGLVELVDHVGPWIVVGLGVAALLEPMLDAGYLAGIDRALAVPLMALIGVPLYVCASGATPLVAILMHKGLGAGAAIAFLLTGPATNITTFGVLRRLHGRRAALAFGLGVAGLACIIGWTVDGFIELPPLDLHDVAAEGASIIEIVALVALGLVFLASLLRQGPRGVLAQVLRPHDEGHHHGHDHGHDHGHACGHDHGHGHACGHDHHHHAVVGEGRDRHEPGEGTEPVVPSGRERPIPGDV